MDKRYHKKALLLSYFTLIYNLLEGILSIIAGVIAGSIALIGFGMDSFSESLSSIVMIWRFRSYKKMDADQERKIENRAIKLVGYTFFILGGYVLYEAVKKLLLQEKPEPSVMGLVIAILSLIIMPLLYVAKNKTGKRIGSMSLVADSKQTLACVFMSLSLLIGLLMNQWFGIWQADPIVGLLIVAYLFKEGFETLREGRLCSC
jgi:cation diffusion facilitator family transporter